MKRPSPPRWGVGIDPLASRTGIAADPRSLSLPFPGFGGARVRASRRRGTAPPRDPTGWLPRCAPGGAGSARGARPAAAARLPPAWGPAVPPSLSGSACPEGSGATSLGLEVVVWGRRAAEAGAPAWGQRPRAWVPKPCLSVRLSVGRGRSVVRASGPRGEAGAPGRARPAHLQPPLQPPLPPPPPPAPRKRDRGAAARVFLAGLVAAPRATALLGETARGSRGRSPRRCRCLLLGRFLQVPSQSAPFARWLPGRLGASAGGRGRRRRRGWEEGRREEGCPLWGRGGRGEGAARGPPHSEGSPGNRAPWPRVLPAATSLCASPGEDLTPGVGSRGLGNN